MQGRTFQAWPLNHSDNLSVSLESVAPRRAAFTNNSQYLFTTSLWEPRTAVAMDPFFSCKRAEVGERDRGSGSGLLVPTEDTQRPQRVPPAGPAVAVLKRKVDLAGMRVLEQPGAIGLLLGSE
jgi:hypothetical protein